MQYTRKLSETADDGQESSSSIKTVVQCEITEHMPAMRRTAQQHRLQCRAARTCACMRAVTLPLS